MTTKRFNAILAKNRLAAEIKDYIHEPENGLHELFVIDCLEEIEKYIGEGNQPSVNDIIK